MATDWVGRWFELMETGGERMDIVFGRAESGGGEPTWTRYPHSRFDGVGAFGALLEKDGYGIVELPGGRDAQAPGPWKQRAALLRHLWIGRRHANNWKALAPLAGGPVPVVAWGSLERAGTSRLLQALKAADLRMTGYLLSCLHRSAPRELLRDPSRTIWMIPANLRGAVSYPDPRANHSSFLQFGVRDGESVRDVDGGLRRLLDKQAHWGPWPVLTIGERRGEKAVRWLDENFAGKPYFRTGAFSNLGAWPGPGGEVRYYFCPPAARSQPVAAGALTWNGILSLCLQIHPALSTDPSIARAWLRRWIDLAAEGPKE